MCLPRYLIVIPVLLATLSAAAAGRGRAVRPSTGTTASTTASSKAPATSAGSTDTATTSGANSGTNASGTDSSRSNTKQPDPNHADKDHGDQASPRSASATVNPDKARLGQIFLYVIEIRDLSTVRYELPPNFTLGSAFEVVKADTARQPNNDETITRFSIQASVFDLGPQQIADLAVVALGAGGEKRSLTIPGPKVTGISSLPENEQAQLKDLEPPVSITVARYTVLYWAAALLVSALAGILIYRYWTSRPQKERISRQSSLPADQLAYQALDALQREDLPGQGKIREFYFRLSEIMRGYLGERFGFAARDMTTEELLATLTRVRTPGLNYARWEFFCRGSDLVKFARLPATVANCKESMEEAFSFIRATTVTADPLAASQNARAPDRKGASAS